MTIPLARAPVSVVVMTLNEERHIQACLESVRWADEIVVVDSCSSDRTVEIARRHTDKIYQVSLTGPGDLGVKRNWAMRNVPFAHEWVLSLDADDRVPGALAAEIAERLPEAGFDGFLISQRYVFMGRALTHCRGPLHQLKLFKHRYYSCEEAIHEQPIFTGSVGYLKNQYIQDNDKALYEYLERHNYYSTREAELYQQLRQQPLNLSIREFLANDALGREGMLKRLWVRLPGRPLLLFLVYYLLRGGFLDGREGLIFSLLRGAGYEFIIDLKLREARDKMEPRAVGPLGSRHE